MSSDIESISSYTQTDQDDILQTADKSNHTQSVFPFLDIYFRPFEQEPSLRLSAKVHAKIEIHSESFISKTLFKTIFQKESPEDEKVRIKFSLRDEQGTLHYLSSRFSVGNENGAHLCLGGNEFLISRKYLILNNELAKIPIYWNGSEFCQNIIWQKLERKSLDEIFVTTPPNKRPENLEG